MSQIDLKTLDDQLNQAILTGKALDAFEELYAADIVMRENAGEPCRGKDANRQREIDFFSSVAELHELKLVSSAVGDGVTFSEWVFDLTFKGGPRKRLEQTAVRRWRGGKVVEERFYYDTAG